MSGPSGDDINKGRKMKIKVISVSTLNAYDKALLKFVENQLLGSIDTLKTFSQTMITLISGMFAVYFAILKFLGIESANNLELFTKDVVGIPPVLFILSIIAFIIAIIPWLTTISYIEPKEIRRIQDTVILAKYTSVIVGIGLFICALVVMLVIFNTLL